MSEDEITRLASVLESDPLFAKLFRATDRDWKVFSRQRFQGGGFSSSIYELDEPSLPRAPASADVEKTLAAHKGLVEKIKTGDELEVMMDQLAVVNKTNGDRYKLKPLGDVLPIIEAGGVFNYARQTGMLK